MSKVFTKNRIWNEVKAIVFQKMDKDIITPDRADEILHYVKKYATDIETPDLAKQFYLFLGEKFIELKELELKFHMEEEEYLEKKVTLLVEYFMNHDNVDLAQSILHRSEISGSLFEFIKILELEYPLELSMITKNIS